MIIQVKKYILMGAKEDLDHFFSRAQQKGILEFIPASGKRPQELPEQAHHLLQAVKILKKLPLKKRYEGEKDLEFAKEVADRVVELNVQINKLAEEKRLLEAEISRILPFGDFSMDDIDFIEKEGKYQIQFFCRKSSKRDIEPLSEDFIYVGTDYDLDYFIAINTEHRVYPQMIEMRIDRPLGELRAHYSFIDESLHQFEAEIKGFAGHIFFLQRALIDHLNEYHLDTAKKGVAFPLENSLFAVEAWIPENKVYLLQAMIDGLAIYAEAILVEETDRVPTYMENKGIARMGEDLVKIYDVPSVEDRDPSQWVFWFFTLFFAMIVADGGYGLLYLGLALYLKWKYPRLKGQLKRLLRLGLILSSACVIWGVLTSAFFGIPITHKSWLGKLSLVQYLVEKKAEYHLAVHDDVYHYWVSEHPSLAQATTAEQFLDGVIVEKGGRPTYEIINTFADNIMMEFSLIIGVIHISLSFLRYLFKHWAGIGWVAFLVGGYLFSPKLLDATSFLHYLGIIDKEKGYEIGLQLIYSGIGTALFLAILQKRLKGLGEIASGVQVFGDVLSYLRLYALGLAGSIMAATFNEIGLSIGLFFGFIVILCGHAVNILLGIQASVIHGLRLNFIEWYHYCFDGGGRLLRPLLCLKPKDH